MALIQEWQPRLNYPFICQFFHPKKGLLKKPLLNTNAQFGLATLWRRAKHKFTPQLVRQVLTSSRFQNRLELWTIIHALGSNTKARFEQTKMLRSNDGGLTLCYALRRLANNTQEPFRTVPECHRRFDPMVAWKTSTQGNSSTGSMVPRSRPSANAEEVSETMARQDAGSPSTMSHSFLQDGLHQTCGSLGHSLQSQTSH